MLGKGEAKAIDIGDYVRIAQVLDCHPATIEAIANVESGGFGWFADGRIKILVEKHVFYRQLKQAGFGGLAEKAVLAGVARRSWISPKKGGYKEQTNANSRYNILAAMIDLDEECAYRSISVGKFQIMGFNRDICGFTSAKQMFEFFVQDEEYQLLAFVRFIKERGLVEALQKEDFQLIETKYNGGGLNGAYALKMAKEAHKLRAMAGRYDVPPTPVPNVPHAIGTKPPIAAPAPGPTAPKPSAPTQPAPQPKRRVRWTIWGVVIALLAAAGYWMGNGGSF